MEFELLMFCYANIKLSNIPHSLLTKMWLVSFLLISDVPRNLFWFPKCWIVILAPVTLHNELFLDLENALNC